MHSVILYIAVSQDGYIATVDGSVDWLEEFNQTGEDYGFTELLSLIDVNIQGANTYKQVVDFDIDWPYESKSIVATSEQLEVPEGADVELNGDSLELLVAHAKEVAKKDIWLIGGAKLAQSMLEAELIDEIMLFTMPVTLGSGIALFKDDTWQSNFQEPTTKTYDSGVTETRFQTK